MTSFAAASRLRQWPRFLRPLIVRIDPSYHIVKDQLARADALIKPIIGKRTAAGFSAEEKKKNAIYWADAISKEYGVQCWQTGVQLNLALSAIHTTSDLVTDTMYNLMQHPEAIIALREEIIEVIGHDGIQTSMLPNLRLMDSALKESQRLKPVFSGQ